MSKFRDYDNYEIFDDGRIWSYRKNKFLKPCTRNGYKRVHLFDNEGNSKMYNVHRVVWEAVSGEPIPEGLEVNHIDENKKNNAFSNLNLLSHRANLNFGTGNARRSKAMTNNQKRSKAVGAFDKNGNLVMTFPSTQEASRQGYKQGNVAACCRGERKTHKGFEWRYI